MHDKTSAADTLIGAITAGALSAGAVRASGRFCAICRDAEGIELWREDFPNLLTMLGKNFLLDQAPRGRSAPPPTSSTPPAR